jgi:surfeit locus 1 family protein
MPGRRDPAVRRRFQPRLFPTLATAVGVGLFVYLGSWQAAVALHQQRSTLPPEAIDVRLLDPGRADAARYTVRGQYEPELQFFLDNQQEAGVPGVQVITPLRIEGSETRILVNRGWIGWPHGRGVLPQVPVPAGPVQVTGMAQVPSTKRMLLMPDRPEPDPRLWNRVDLDRFAAQAQRKVQPVLLLQDAGDAVDGLIRHWPPPEDRSLKHHSYAMQWFAMALALLVFYAVASVRKPAVQGGDDATEKAAAVDAPAGDGR